MRAMQMQNNLRIVLYDPSGHGGICHYTYKLAESLARQGNDVTVMTTEDYELKHLNRIFKIYALFSKSRMKDVLTRVFTRILSVDSNHKYELYKHNTSKNIQIQESTTLLALRNFRLWLIRLKAIFFFFLYKPHIIHFQWLTNPKEDLYFINILKLLKFNVVYTAHDLLPNKNYSSDDYKIYKSIYQTVDQIIVHSDENKREMISNIHIDTNKISIIPHGSYDLFFTYNTRTRKTLSHDLGIMDRKRVVLFFGIIKRYKGLEYLVEAFLEVKKILDDIVLLIVGKTYDGNNEDFEYYSRLFDDISDYDDIICVNTYIPFEEIGSYFLASDVVVLPYVKTYTSGVLLAAYAAGKPVIVTDTGALGEVVEAGKSGLIVPPKDVKALTQAIVEIVRDADRIETMGQYAKYLAETTYAWENIALKT